MGGRDHI
jgi:hypothetical protein